MSDKAQRWLQLKQEFQTLQASPGAENMRADWTLVCTGEHEVEKWAVTGVTQRDLVEGFETLAKVAGRLMGFRGDSLEPWLRHLIQQGGALRPGVSLSNAESTSLLDVVRLSVAACQKLRFEAPPESRLAIGPRWEAEEALKAEIANLPFSDECSTYVPAILRYAERRFDDEAVADITAVEQLAGRIIEEILPDERHFRVGDPFDRRGAWEMFLPDSVAFLPRLPNIERPILDQLTRSLANRLGRWRARARANSSEGTRAPEPVLYSATQKHSDRSALELVDDDFLDRRAAVREFISKLSEAGHKITRKQLWLAAGYTDPTQFERYQRHHELTTRASADAFKRVLLMTPDDFIRLLKRKVSAK